MEWKSKYVTKSNEKQNENEIHNAAENHEKMEIKNQIRMEKDPRNLEGKKKPIAKKIRKEMDLTKAKD